MQPGMKANRVDRVMCTNTTRALVASAAALGLMAAAAQRTAAHPHVFVKVRTELVAKDGALVGLRHTWIFDQIWLENQLLEHDKDNDGKLTREELAPLETESRQTLELFRSFTLLRAGGNMVRVANPRDVVVEYHGAVLGMSFTVSLAKPVPLLGSELLLETYDATYFSSFMLDGAEAVRFAEPAPPGCTIQVGVPASPQQMNAYRMIKKQMGAEWVDTGGTPTSTSIKCARPDLTGDALSAATQRSVSAK